jgi:transcriptional regulator NrdR family protein
MKCPLCDNPRTIVLRTTRGGSHVVVRRRLCTCCRHRWNTFEVSESEFQTIQRAQATVERLRAALVESG